MTLDQRIKKPWQVMGKSIIVDNFCCVRPLRINDSFILIILKKTLSFVESERLIFNITSVFNDLFQPKKIQEFQAEHKLRTDFVGSTPRVNNLKVDGRRNTPFRKTGPKVPLKDLFRRMINQ
jgi:hypothetical protein